MSVTFVKEDPDTKDLYLVIPDSILDQLGWNIGDTLIWDIQDNYCRLSRINDDSTRDI